MPASLQIDTTPELFQFKPRRDRATKLLAFLGDVIVNGNSQSKGYRPKGPVAVPAGATGTACWVAEPGTVA